MEEIDLAAKTTAAIFQEDFRAILLKNHRFLLVASTVL
jgi:hypothetical protein